MLVQITWQFNLLFVLEDFRVMLSCLLDSNEKLHGSTSCVWTLWRVQFSETSAFGNPQSLSSLRTNHEFLCFSCAHKMIFRANIFSFWSVPYEFLSSLFIVTHVSILACRVFFSSLTLSTSFFVVNAFYPNLILWKLSASISRHIFPIQPKQNYNVTSLIFSLPTNKMCVIPIFQKIYFYFISF